MDPWIIAFVVLIVVVFLISFKIPQLAMRPPTRKRPSEQENTLAANTASKTYSPDELVVHDDVKKNEFDDDIFFDIDNYTPPSVKGLRIALKQFSNELDTFLREIDTSPQIMSYHRNKYIELHDFFVSTTNAHKKIISEEELNDISDKLEKARQIIGI
ncbi:MAG: hypothetical protein ACXQS3_05645 [Candidatus Methanofastidiosia archaeon]